MRFALLAAVAMWGAAGLWPRALRAQAPAAAAPAADSSARLRVYLDCRDFQFCDFDFFRTEIAFVDWVRDPAQGDVHVLVTSEGTGGGGARFTLAFLGRDRLAGVQDTLRHSAGKNDTQDQVRRELARLLQLGLVRYALRTESAARLAVRYDAPAAGAAPAAAKRDPWNYWVFSVNANGNTNGEKSAKFVSFYPSLSATRTTAAWKLRFSVSGNYSESKFDLAGDRSAFYSHSVGSDFLTAKSMGEHWSAGLTGGTSSSTFSNIDFSERLGPAVEYDVFPYSQSTRRIVTLRYSVTGSDVRYREQTIYFKSREQLVRHALNSEIGLTQPWGGVSLAVSGGQYLHDPSKWSADSFGSFNVRLFKGLRLNMFGGYSALRDQLFLPAAGATRDEILLRQRQLATSYSYFGGGGLSYSFGSIYNNVVNPRFGREGGQVFFF